MNFEEALTDLIKKEGYAIFENPSRARAILLDKVGCDYYSHRLLELFLMMYQKRNLYEMFKTLGLKQGRHECEILYESFKQEYSTRELVDAINPLAKVIFPTEFTTKANKPMSQAAVIKKATPTKNQQTPSHPTPVKPKANPQAPKKNPVKPQVKVTPQAPKKNPVNPQAPVNPQPANNNCVIKYQAFPKKQTYKKQKNPLIKWLKEIFKKDKKGTKPNALNQTALKSPFKEPINKLVITGGYNNITVKMNTQSNTLMVYNKTLKKYLDLSKEIISNNELDLYLHLNHDNWLIELPSQSIDSLVINNKSGQINVGTMSQYIKVNSLEVHNEFSTMNIFTKGKNIQLTNTNGIINLTHSANLKASAINLNMQSDNGIINFKVAGPINAPTNIQCESQCGSITGHVWGMIPPQSYNSSFNHKAIINGHKVELKIKSNMGLIQMN